MEHAIKLLEKERELDCRRLKKRRKRPTELFKRFGQSSGVVIFVGRKTI